MYIIVFLGVYIIVISTDSLLPVSSIKNNWCDQIMHQTYQKLQSTFCDLHISMFTNG